jgi:hypothetical protein
LSPKKGSGKTAQGLREEEAVRISKRAVYESSALCICPSFYDAGVGTYCSGHPNIAGKKYSPGRHFSAFPSYPYIDIFYNLPATEVTVKSYHSGLSGIFDRYIFPCVKKEPRSKLR